MTEIDHFMPLLMQREEEGVLAPLLSHGRVHPMLGRSAENPTQRAETREQNLHNTCAVTQVVPGLGGSRNGWGDSRGHVTPLHQKCRFFLNLTAPVVATTLKNANASLVYSFLYKTVEVSAGLSLASWSVCIRLWR